jgi:ribonuclease E
VPSGVEAASEAAAVEYPAGIEPDAEAVAAPSFSEAPAEAAPTRPTPRPAPVAEPVTAAAAVPAVVARFELPTRDLQAVAEAAGLQWVNSDEEKIRAVQEAMAREPKPTHVPREPKPVVAIDEGPLVLVETRKDLTQFKLPFETAQGSQKQA